MGTKEKGGKGGNVLFVKETVIFQDGRQKWVFVGKFKMATLGRSDLKVSDCQILPKMWVSCAASPTEVQSANDKFCPNPIWLPKVE